MLPKDPVILLSVINTKLRDFYPSLSELCQDLSENEAEICKKLSEIGYEYNPEQNKFE